MTEVLTLVANGVRQRALVAVLGVLAMGAAAGGCSPAKQLAESTATATCEPAVRLDRDVKVMFRNEWLNGQLALAVCRGSEAQTKGLDAFKAWLADEAREGRIRNCAMPVTLRPLSESERSAAAAKLAGVRDWCFSLTAEI